MLIIRFTQNSSLTPALWRQMFSVCITDRPAEQDPDLLSPQLAADCIVPSPHISRTFPKQCGSQHQAASWSVALSVLGNGK